MTCTVITIAIIIIITIVVIAIVIIIAHIVLILCATFSNVVVFYAQRLGRPAPPRLARILKINPKHPTRVYIPKPNLPHCHFKHLPTAHAPRHAR